MSTINQFEEQQAQTVFMVIGMLSRLAGSRDLLSQEQRFHIAEELRDCADALDCGKVYRPASPLRPLRRLVPASKRDYDGNPCTAPAASCAVGTFRARTNGGRRTGHPQ
jgi:hypothetical protein